MYHWVKRKISEKNNGFTIKKVDLSEGVIVDKSNFPTPVGPIWLQRLNPKNGKETLNL